MKIRELERIIRQEPFKPYCLRLVSGEEIVVDRPRKSHVSGDVVAAVGRSRQLGTSRVVEKLRIINVDDIASAETVDVPIRPT